MQDSKLSMMSIPALLQLHGSVIDELQQRSVLRSKNNPVGDYTEWLVSTMLGLTRMGGSNRSVDAVDASGARFQIKGRRVTPENKSVQLGAIRRLEHGEFDYLVAVLFEANFSVKQAFRIPHAIVKSEAKFKPHSNCHVLHARSSLLKLCGVEEITDQLRT